MDNITLGYLAMHYCSSLKNHLSATNHRTDMKLVVYDPNTSKNEWTFISNLFIMKNWPKQITIFKVFWGKHFFFVKETKDFYLILSIKPNGDKINALLLILH